jgi:hypothetical protein
VQVVNPGAGSGISNVVLLGMDPTLTQGLPELLDYAYDGTEANQGVCGNQRGLAKVRLELLEVPSRPNQIHGE